MEYTEVRISIVPFTEDNADWVVAEIESLGYESFCIQESCLLAYIPSSRFDFGRLTDALEVFAGHLELEVSHAPVPEQNWNAIWESSFEPIVVDGECTIKATFHKGLPETRYNITIDPKMAFGTGHHQTTYMMCRALLRHEADIKGKIVMDMGCGTAILAILAAKMGAGHTYGIDIDAVAAASAFDNARKNRVSRHVETYCGDASLLQRGKYDILLANINRNILLEDIPTYAVSLKKDGLLFVSGFYTEDFPMICSSARRAGLEYMEQDAIDNWCCAGFRKV